MLNRCVSLRRPTPQASTFELAPRCATTVSTASPSSRSAAWRACWRTSRPPAGPTIDLALGEPRHAPPPLLAETVAANAHLWNRYPPVPGTPEFRAAAAGWLTRRFHLPAGALDPDRHVVPLAGTKEGLYLLPSLRRPEPRTDRRC